MKLLKNLQPNVRAHHFIMKQIKEAKTTGCIGIKEMNELIDTLEQLREERKAMFMEFERMLNAM